MNKKPTPETDAARVSVDTYAGEYLVDPDPQGRWVEAAFAEGLEHQRDAYAETIREFLREADEIDERHPELAKP